MTSTTRHRFTMTPKEQHYYKALGKRIAARRQENGWTQTTLADALGIAQQTLAHYEGGRLRLPVALLPELSYQFAISTDELLGVHASKGKRGPTPKLQQQIEKLSRLPKAKQKVVMEMIDGVLR